jgi:hypothetical protein
MTLQPPSLDMGLAMQLKDGVAKSPTLSIFYTPNHS